MNAKFVILNFILLTINVGAIFGQTKFQSITKKDGLPHNQVECIYMDSDGFMWFGTRFGLCRYDGYDVRVFYHSGNHKSTISGNWILSIAEDKNGYLWVGTKHSGLNRLDRKTLACQQINQNSGFGRQIHAITTLDNGLLALGTDFGMALYSPDTGLVQIFHPNDAPDNINSFAVSDIYQTSNGDIYVATMSNQIQKFDIKSSTFEAINYEIPVENNGNYRKRMLEDSNGNLWIAANQHGLSRFNPATGRSTTFSYESGELTSNSLSGDMIEAGDGKIWIASDDGGMNIFDPKSGKFEHIVFDKNKESGLPDNHIYSLFIDNSNRIWIGFYNSGVAFYDPLAVKFENMFFPDKIFEFFRSKSVISIFQDSGQNIWLGTDGDGLHKITQNFQIRSFYSKSGANSISSNVITSIAETPHGDILAGTYSGGLNVIDSGTGFIKTFKTDNENPQSVHSNNIWRILVDSEQRIWLGMLGNGLDRFMLNDNEFRNHGPFSNEIIKVGHANIMALFEDSDGDLWFGSEGHGIYFLDNQTRKVMQIRNIEETQIFTEGKIKTFYQDKWGKMWIGTEGNGLIHFDKYTQEIEIYTKENGLPGNIVLGIVEDKAGTIWAATYDGLAAKKTNDEAFKEITTEDGLSSNELNAETLIMLDNGHIIVGSINGINIFNPFTMKTNQNIPKVYFTKLKALNNVVSPGESFNDRVILQKDLAYTNHITLKHNDKSFSIEFAALNYTLAQKCKYKYMLEGFDEDWIQTEKDRRVASYTNLDHGNYTLKVKASNNDYKWGNNTSTLKITILPPFWKTWWFAGVVVFILSAILLFIYRYRQLMARSRNLRDKAISEKQIIELEKINIESELEKLTFHTINRNRVLIQLNTRLNTLSKKAKESVKNSISSIMNDIDKEIADQKEWKYIEPRLDKFYNGFINKLREKHPDITLTEIKVATYVRMNLSSKEISEIMHKTIRAIENDRYRLRKKIGITSNESLQDYLMNL